MLTTRTPLSDSRRLAPDRLIPVRVWRADRDDARFRTLPLQDGTPRYLALRAPTFTSARMALGLLADRGWCLHPAGAVTYAHGPCGARWIIGYAIGIERPSWWERLAARPGAVVTGPDGVARRNPDSPEWSTGR